MMKRIMILSESDLVRDGTAHVVPALSNLKQNIIKEEVNYDIIAYFENDKLILLKIGWVL
ncbi:MAG: hypothetical protein JXO44_14740 [Clostridia bacterium]|nr:hypothetical protein [Clostridia bacterium]